MAATGPIATFSGLVGGAAYTNGTYSAVPLTGGSGSGAYAHITVAGNAVTAVTLPSPTASAVLDRTGKNYVAGNTLTATAASIGGTGAGFTINVATIAKACENCYHGKVVPISGGQLFGTRYCGFDAIVNNLSQTRSPLFWDSNGIPDDYYCSDGSDAVTGRSFADPISGIPGTGGAGPGYLATSTTNFVIAAAGAVPLATQLNLAYTPGARVRATSAGTGAWMEGVVTAYSATGLLTFTADTSSGAGAHADWNINLAGQPGLGGVSSRGTFTLGGGVNLFAVADVNVTATSRIIITPTSQTASDLQAISAAEAVASASGEASAAYISVKTVGVSFTMQAGNGGVFAGTETFDYVIVN